MVIAKNKETITADVELKELTWSTSAENQYHLMKLNFSRLYKEPINSIVRELASNARDATIAAGNINPFVVKIDDNLFSITDFGTGLTPEAIDCIIHPGSSTKREDNKQTGGFGIGSKSPFSYTDIFFYESVSNGVKTIIDFVDTGTKYAINVNSEPTDETINYTKVEFGITKEELWLKAVETQLAFFDNFVLDYKGEISSPKIRKFNTFIYSSWNTDYTRLLNGVAIVNHNLYKMDTKYCVGIRCSIEELSPFIDHSRENLNIAADELVYSKVDKVEEEIQKLLPITDDIYEFLNCRDSYLVIKDCKIFIQGSYNSGKNAVNRFRYINPDIKYINWRFVLESKLWKDKVYRSHTGDVSQYIFDYKTRYSKGDSKGLIRLNNQLAPELKVELEKYLADKCFIQDVNVKNIPTPRTKSNLYKVVRDSQIGNESNTAIDTVNIDITKGKHYYSTDEATARLAFIVFKKIGWNVTVIFSKKPVDCECIDDWWMKPSKKWFRLRKKFSNFHYDKVSYPRAMGNLVSYYLRDEDEELEIAYKKYLEPDYAAWRDSSKLLDKLRKKYYMKVLKGIYVINFDNIGKSNLKLEEKWQSIKSLK